MTNLEIYDIGKELNKAFPSDDKNLLPIKLNFKIQKNKKNILELAKEVENSLFLLYNKYGEREEDSIFIPQDKIQDYQKEYDDLMSIEQDVDIMKISLNEIDDNVELTSAQMESILFMINEE